MVVSLLLLAACSADTDDDGGASSPSGSYPVRMVDDEFSPTLIEAEPGTTLRFTNDGRNPHNAVAVDGSFSTIATFGAEAMTPGDRAEVDLPDEPGVIPFYCTFHGSPDGTGMAGVIAVGEVDEAELAAALGGDRAEPVAAASGTTLRVPEDHDTIQAAVDAAAPGDLILVGPGVYRESVQVHTPSLTIRGTDRDEVVIDGEFERTNGIGVFEADGVVIENMTARNHVLNGFYWTGVEGYRGEYLTAYNNADYGIYAFDATDGVLAHSYASGSPDAGFYIGQCDRCRSVVYDVVSEHNAIGYSGTNAGGELYLVSSVWRNNRSGIVPNSLDTELDPPQVAATVVANLVHDNNNDAAVAKGFGHLAMGTGVVVGGGVANVVSRNVVIDHGTAGVVVAPLPDRNIWLSIANEVRDNVVAGSGIGDLVMPGPSGGGNCFSGNRFETSVPPGLQAFHGCSGLRLPMGWDLSGTTLLLAREAADTPDFTFEDVAAQPAPGPQRQLPGGPDAPVRPALTAFDDFDEVDLDDLASIPLPDGAERIAATRSPEVTVSGLDVTAPTGWQLFFGFYAYLLPFALLTTWMALAFWDLARRDDLGRGAGIGWAAVILLVPVLGVVVYHAVAARFAGWLRWTVVAGGAVAYLVILGVGAVVGGLA